MSRIKLEQVDFETSVRINGNTTTQIRDDANARNPAAIEYDTETGFLHVTPRRGESRTLLIRADRFQAYPKTPEPAPAQLAAVKK